MSMFLKEYKPSEIISEFSEFKSDTSELGWNPKHHHKSYTESGYSTRRKTPKIC